MLQASPEQEQALQKQLAGLAKLSRHALMVEFEEVYGRPPPLRLSASILALAIAYRLQEQLYGGLRSEVRQALLAGKTAIPAKASPGTMLIREWHGVEHVVTVHSSHVEYRGQRYSSLSQVAYLISGNKRSGPQFFGLRKSR